jgi:undecaprenyl-diphosphatase
MTAAHALLLGLLQGFGEFLPISSSGHLIVAPWLLGWPMQSLSFDVALHLGTLFAVLAAFAGDWIRLIRGAASGLAARAPFRDPDARLFWLIALASLPGAIAGKLLEEKAETAFRAPALVAAAMAVMGVILWIADRRGRDVLGATGMPVAHAALIGLAQALALVPGVSRSGVTISAALLLGYRREEAARFSFLLATPITFGAAVLKVPHLMHGEAAGAALIGMAAAAVAGFLSIKVLLAYVRKKDYLPFVWYRFAFAAIVGVVVVLRGRA